MQFFDIMRMSIRFGLVFGLSSLLSAAIVAFTVVRLSEFADSLAAAPVNRPRTESVRIACSLCVRIVGAVLTCGVLTWWIMRIAPFPRMG